VILAADVLQTKGVVSLASTGDLTGQLDLGRVQDIVTQKRGVGGDKNTVLQGLC
jgi:hypothetical protein